MTHTDDSTKKIRRLEISDSSLENRIIEIDYFLKVEQNRYGNECPLCNLGIPYSNNNEHLNDLILFSREDDYVMIPSYDQWESSFEAGISVEVNHPEHRRKIPILIDYQKLLKNDGAWIAFKIKNRLLREGFYANTVIVSPQGGGSENFSKMINLTLKKEVITIPHDVIDACIKKEANLERLQNKWERDNPEWYKSLHRRPMRVIIMEEFNITGQTFIAIEKIMKQLTHKVVCFFPLNNLNPDFIPYSDVPIFTLYEWKSFEMNNNLLS